MRNKSTESVNTNRSRHHWMPFYVGDYLMETQGLDAEGSGAYLHLQMHYWVHGELPVMDRELSRIAKVSAHKWKKLRPTIEKFFAAGWKHSRLDKERKKACEISEKRRIAGSKAHRRLEANAPAIARQLPTQSQPQSHIPPSSTTAHAYSHENLPPASPSAHGVGDRHAADDAQYDEIVTVMSDHLCITTADDPASVRKNVGAIVACARELKMDAIDGGLIARLIARGRLVRDREKNVFLPGSMSDYAEAA